MKQEDLARGFIDVRVRISGVYQKHRFIVSELTNAAGKFKCLIGEDRIPQMELLRVANELDIPIKTTSSMVFPIGKSGKDFVF
jgi:hypothetical protein